MNKVNGFFLMLDGINRPVSVPGFHLSHPLSPHHGHSHCLLVIFASAPHIGQRILPVLGSGLDFGGSFGGSCCRRYSRTKKNAPSSSTTAIAAICSFVMLSLFSLVILAARCDIERAVYLFEHHDPREMMRERHGRHGQPQRGPLLDALGQTARAADELIRLR